MNAGIATAARMPTIATTIINSMRGKPREGRLFRFIYGTLSNGYAGVNCWDLRAPDPGACRTTSPARQAVDDHCSTDRASITSEKQNAAGRPAAFRAFCLAAL